MNKRLSGVLGGAVGGLAGAILGHLAVRLAYRWTGDANLWFKGPHGPPFFDLMMTTAVFYAGVGAGLYAPGRRAAGAGLGFLAPFLAILLPLALATRLFAWGEDPAPPTYAWAYLVVGAYLSATVLAVCLLGAFSGKGFRWKPGLGALGGSFVGYLAGLGILRLAASDPLALPGLWPNLGAILDGTVNGGCIAAGVVLMNRRNHDQA